MFLFTEPSARALAVTAAFAGGVLAGVVVRTPASVPAAAAPVESAGVMALPAVARAYRAEVLRVIDALQLTDNYTVATPGNWRNGDDVIIPLSIQDEAVIKQKFPKGYTSPRPYLRITPQPNK